MSKSAYERISLDCQLLVVLVECNPWKQKWKHIVMNVSFDFPRVVYKSKTSLHCLGYTRA